MNVGSALHDRSGVGRENQRQAHHAPLHNSEYMIDMLQCWKPEPDLTLFGAGGFTAMVLAQHGHRLKQPI